MLYLYNPYFSPSENDNEDRRNPITFFVGSDLAYEQDMYGSDSESDYESGDEVDYESGDEDEDPESDTIEISTPLNPNAPEYVPQNQLPRIIKLYKRLNPEADEFIPQNSR